MAQAAGLSSGAVTTLLDRLERAGYVPRVRDPSDRRRVMVELTAEADRATGEVWGPLGEEARADLEFCRTAYNANDLEELAMLGLRAAAKKERLAAMARRQAELRLKHLGNPQEEVKICLAALAALDVKEEQIADLLLNGISQPVVQKKLEALHGERDALQRQLAGARARIGTVEDPKAAARHAEEVSERLAKALVEAEVDPARFRELCRIFLSITIYRDKRPRIETRIPSTLNF